MFGISADNLSQKASLAVTCIRQSHETGHAPHTQKGFLVYEDCGIMGEEPARVGGILVSHL